jgi:hypothetical protein
MQRKRIDMARRSVVLRRKPGSLLDVLPLRDCALAYFQSIEGLEHVRVERRSNTEVELSFEWDGEVEPTIPEDYLDRYGLERGD